MTLRELINCNAYKNVFNFLYKIYYKDKDSSEVEKFDVAYLDVWNNLIKKKLNLKKDYKILIKEFPANPEDEFSESFIDVCLEEKGEIFSIDLVIWNDLIDVEVCKKADICDAEALAHILWEITFYGFSEAQIENFRKSLDKLSKENGESIDLEDLF
tara:strand:- start:1015 stop:1485 length:471 start_codon:yes stop_codon:yes gene_type:complete